MARSRHLKFSPGTQIRRVLDQCLAGDPVAVIAVTLGMRVQHVHAILSSARRAGLLGPVGDGRSVRACTVCGERGHDRRECERTEDTEAPRALGAWQPSSEECARCGLRGPHECLPPPWAFATARREWRYDR